MTRLLVGFTAASVLALSGTLAAQGQAPAAGRGAGIGVPADAPPPRSVAPGPHAVTVQSYPTLPTHTAYHPTALEGFGPAKRLPIVSWGNGACARNGSAFETFLTQVASHGAISPSPSVQRRSLHAGRVPVPRRRLPPSMTR